MSLPGMASSQPGAFAFARLAVVALALAILHACSSAGAKTLCSGEDLPGLGFFVIGPAPPDVTVETFGACDPIVCADGDSGSCERWAGRMTGPVGSSCEVRVSTPSAGVLCDITVTLGQDPCGYVSGEFFELARSDDGGGWTCIR